MIDQESYRFTLDAFCGPLDLLLFLIRRAEVDVRDIPVAQITDQYLAFLRQLHDVDIDQAGEFLVMAASLIEVKSRCLAPRPEGAADDAEERSAPEALEDPRAELIQQLLEYQRHRLAAEALEERRREFMRRVPSGGGALAGVERTPLSLELEDVSPFDLAAAYERVISAIDLSRLGDHRVEVDDTPIALYQEDLLDRLRRAGAGRLVLQQAFEGQGRLQRVGFFLATLELVRLRQVTVTQPELDGEIEVVLREEESG
jgi:segregation and condensation protein A